MITILLHLRKSINYLRNVKYFFTFCNEYNFYAIFDPYLIDQVKSFQFKQKMTSNNTARIFKANRIRKYESNENTIDFFGIKTDLIG